MPSIRKHYTRQAANAGKKIFIPGPDGQPTEDWIVVYGQDSDAFIAGQRRLRDQVMAYIEEHGADCQKTKEFEKFRSTLMDDLKLTLVKEWCFDEEVNPENIREFFENAPNVASLVDMTAGKRELFVLTSPSDSNATLNSSSNSTCQPEMEPSKPEEKHSQPLGDNGGENPQP